MNFKTRRYLLLIVIVLPALFSCKKDKDVSIDVGYGYFPNELGKYVIYDVDSIVHDDFKGKVDTFKFQIKEFIQSFYTDNSGRQTQRIERSKRIYNKSISYDLIPWKLMDIWCANLTPTSAEKVEENQRFVKLTFAVEQDKMWNGNVLNTIGQQNYIYTETDVSKHVGANFFDSTLVVTQLDKENLIEKQYFVEMYAKNVGLVYKQIIDVKSKTITNAYIMDRISSGIQYKMTINSFGSY